jgi:hypothetical protein
MTAPVPPPVAAARRALAAAVDAGAPVDRPLRDALAAIIAHAGELAAAIEISHSEYASERGRSGESHRLWRRRCLPLAHELGAVSREASESGGFLVRRTVRTELHCRTLVAVDDGALAFLFWRASVRGTEHGSEREARAVGILPATVDRAIAMAGAPLLARAVAGAPLRPAASDDEPGHPSHLAPRPPSAQPFFRLELPVPGACAQLADDGGLFWGPEPSCGYRRDDDSMIDFGPDPGEPAPAPATDDEAAIASWEPHAFEPLAACDLEPLDGPPEPWVPSS